MEEVRKSSAAEASASAQKLEQRLQKVGRELEEALGKVAEAGVDPTSPACRHGIRLPPLAR